MDPIPGSNKEHEHSEQPKSAVEEALLRIGQALEQSVNDYKRLPFLRFKSRFYMQGVIKALTLVFGMLHELHHKYDNSRGDFN